MTTGQGTVVIAGVTNSALFPTTPGAFDTTHDGGYWDAFVTHLDLGPTIGLSQTGGPGTPFTIDNANLIPGNVYYNIFSLDLCPAGPGTGPYLGLCVTTLPNAQFIVLQASLPVGWPPPFHFVATAPTASWGPLHRSAPARSTPVCLDVTGRRSGELLSGDADHDPVGAALSQLPRLQISFSGLASRRVVEVPSAAGGSARTTPGRGDTSAVPLRRRCPSWRPRQGRSRVSHSR